MTDYELFFTLKGQERTPRMNRPTTLKEVGSAGITSTGLEGTPDMPAGGNIADPRAASATSPMRDAFVVGLRSVLKL